METDQNNEILSLTQALISAESVTPDDAGCQALLGKELESLGFKVEEMPFGDVSNLWACHGDGAPYFVFAGHTDVVPPGPISDWSTPPFTPTLIGDLIYGRGAADMKGSLAAMINACKNFLSESSEHNGTLAFLITSDEEGDAINGTRKVLETLKSRSIDIDWCVIGEPSSRETLGDVVKTGRRGSLHAEMKIIGIQGHVAYPNDADNPIHRAMPALDALVNEAWDKGNEFFPPTTMQISNIHGGTGATNVIPGAVDLLLNFRFSTESTENSLKQRTEEILNQHNINYQIKWTLSGNPFLTTGGELIPAVQRAILDSLSIETELSTSGGTSDGRFIEPSGAQVVELGPRNATIHKVNECVSVSDLKKLSIVYCKIMQQLLR
ncbi:MAG: succinyl-diaminopimelate desuccinylase [Candidatus Azotimanducaceae bacterium]